jgi:hypothetical protein
MHAGAETIVEMILCVNDKNTKHSSHMILDWVSGYYKRD